MVRVKTRPAALSQVRVNLWPGDSGPPDAVHLVCEFGKAVSAVSPQPLAGHQPNSAKYGSSVPVGHSSTTSGLFGSIVSW